MKNLVEKFTPKHAECSDDDGLVAIEYVVGAALVAGGVGIVFATDLWDKMNAELDSLFP
jgi:hypothetical protein